MVFNLKKKWKEGKIYLQLKSDVGIKDGRENTVLRLLQNNSKVKKCKTRPSS
jgi:hypothetical protein